MVIKLLEKTALANMVVVHNNLVPARRDHLENDTMDILWLEIFMQNQKSVLLGYVYRSRNSTPQWTECFENMLNVIDNEDKELLILGDFNVDLSSITHTPHAWSVLKSIFNLEQLVRDPTRTRNT